jgi:hypothetical protein
MSETLQKSAAEAPKRTRKRAHPPRVGWPDPDAVPAAEAEGATDADATDSTDAATAGDSVLDDVPVFCASPRRLHLTDLHCRILVQLNERSDYAYQCTSDIAVALDLTATGIGPALHLLKKHDLVRDVIDAPIKQKCWQLTDAGRSMLKFIGAAIAVEAEARATVAPMDSAPDFHSEAVTVTSGPVDRSADHYEPLSDADLDTFLDLPISFRDMLQAVHRSGYVTARQSAPDLQSVLNKFEDVHELLRRAAGGGV